MSDAEYQKSLKGVAGLEAFISSYTEEETTAFFLMELVLNGLASFGIISKEYLGANMTFKDELANMFNSDSFFEEE